MLTDKQKSMLAVLMADKPQSICSCGHTGDGNNSEHSRIDSHGHFHMVEGHGKCRVPGCKCGQFTWADWSPEMKVAIKKAEVVEDE